ncbi:hypothetical protein F5146DRAFT_439502 [Armillaria mellea]|nr:hypothetical protein F5146DRAFT_439502 [Armillaria mellea]
MTKGRRNEKRIPVALHSELTEYSSLLRALRTERTLDVSSQISKHFQSIPTVVDDDYDSEDEDEADSRSTSPVAGPSSQSPSQIAIRKRKSDEISISSTPPLKRKKKQQQADIWTKWPLLPEDIPQLQWGLEDEISVIVSQLQKMRQQGNEDDDDEGRQFLPHLRLSTSNCLEAILGTIAAHTPLRPDSMQNRLNPIDWRFVLNVLVDQKIVHPKCVHCSLLYIFTNCSTYQGHRASGNASTSYVRPQWYSTIARELSRSTDN